MNELFEYKLKNNKYCCIKDVFNFRNKDQWIDVVDEELNNKEKLNIFQINDTVPEKSNIISSH